MRGSKSSYLRAQRRRSWLRYGLILLALAAVYTGVWAAVWPRSFFAAWPGLGWDWAAARPPYNEELVRDLGALWLGLAVVSLWAAVTLGVRMVQGVLVAWLAVSLPRLLWDARDPGSLAGVARISELAILAASVLVPLVLLVFAARLERRPSRL